MATYYIDKTGGDDGNDGLSEVNAWETITKVNSTSFSAGDIIKFKRGETWTGILLTCDNSGTNANTMVTYQDYGSGNKPKIENTKAMPREDYYVIQITANWVKLRNLHIRDGGEAGVFIGQWSFVDGDNCIVEYCEIDNVGVGVKILGENNEIMYNEIHDLHMVYNTEGGDDDWGAVGIWFFEGNNEAHHNSCVDCRDESYDYGYDGGAFEIWAGRDVNNIKIHHNYTEGCEGFLEIGGTGTPSVDNLQVYYNIAYNNYNVFTDIHCSGGPAVDLSNCKIYNNTIVDTITYGARPTSVLWFNGSPGSGDYTFKNNIVYTTSHWFCCASDQEGWTWTHEYNCYQNTSSGGELGFTPGTGEIDQDPKFVNLGGEDFHLQSDSPCRNAGLDVGLSEDYEGNTVPYGAYPDIGAFEKQRTRSKFFLIKG